MAKRTDSAAKFTTKKTGENDVASFQRGLCEPSVWGCES